MRYKVVYVKLKNLPRNVSHSEPPDRTNSLESQETKLQQHQNMILVENPDSGFVERKNAINKMVNTETPEDLRENEQKETFQYQVPRVRASFTLKVAPDSTTADLPESTPTNEIANSSDEKGASCNEYDVNPLSNEAHLPQYGPNLPEYDPATPELDRQMPDFRPHMPTQVPVIHHVPRVPKPALANRSGSHLHNDDKDFEIPLEESLKAVEDFIKREKELARWHIGEDVLAKWKGNGLFYKAKILEILPSGVVVVIYDSYDITEEIDYRDLCKFFKKTSHFKKKGKPVEKPKPLVDDKKKMRAKKQMQIKRKKKPCKKLPFVSIFKRSDRLRKKQLFACYKKSRNLHVLRSRKVSCTHTNVKSRIVS